MSFITGTGKGTKGLDTQTVKYSTKIDCVRVGQGMANINATSHHTFISIKLKFDEVVSFNREHLGAHPQTCGFKGTLLNFNKNKCCDSSTSTNRKEIYSINSPK